MYQSAGASSRDDAVKQKPEELEIKPVRQSASASQEPHKKCALFFQLSGLPRGFVPLHQSLPTAHYESLCHCPPGRIPGARDRGPAGMPP